MKDRVRVDLDGRMFYVTFVNGEPTRIQERKEYDEATPYEGWYNISYWSAKHHKLGADWTMPVRILKAARTKLKQ
jgi:hypothetical protein